MTRAFSLSFINWMASSTPLTVMMGSSGPKISSFITLDSPVTSFNTVGAARREEDEADSRERVRLHVDEQHREGRVASFKNPGKKYMLNYSVMEPTIKSSTIYT